MTLLFVILLIKVPKCIKRDIKIQIKSMFSLNNGMNYYSCRLSSSGEIITFLNICSIDDAQINGFFGKVYSLFSFAVAGSYIWKDSHVLIKD